MRRNEQRVLNSKMVVATLLDYNSCLLFEENKTETDGFLLSFNISK